MGWDTLLGSPFVFIGGALVLALLPLAIWASFCVIAENEAGLVIKKFGPPLTAGRIIALHGEAGYQAELLPPGVHFGLWRWRYKIVKVPAVIARPGHIALVVANDGAAIPADRILGREGRLRSLPGRAGVPRGRR